ncbi:MAG: hypothetical protein H0V17_36545 [Deltaproteobacteria bacterium]|nr:hypothetical protein [Deltaproteobacteria bacterium]
MKVNAKIENFSVTPKAIPMTSSPARSAQSDECHPRRSDRLEAGDAALSA